MASRPKITSRQNPRVKEAALLRTSRERRRKGRFLVDGSREIERAIASGIQCAEAFVCDELCESPDGQRVLRAVTSSAADVFSVTPAVYAKLAFGERDEGLVVVALSPRHRLDELRLPPRPIIAILEGIEKPGNVGAILRSADAAGLDAVIVADGRTDLFNPNTIRASLGTVFRANICEATTEEAIKWLRAQGVPIIVARPDAEHVYSAVDLSRGGAIVLGSEAAGLSEAWGGADVTPVRLPMHGIADSLNVSTAAAVLFYEALRQRGGR